LPHFHRKPTRRKPLRKVKFDGSNTVSSVSRFHFAVCSATRPDRLLKQISTERGTYVIRPVNKRSVHNNHYCHFSTLFPNKVMLITIVMIITVISIVIL
jgi:hypothetical protein